MSMPGFECDADDTNAIIVNMVSNQAVPCSHKPLSVTSRLCDGQITVGQTITPEGVPCWALIFQVTFKQPPEGVMWLSIETDSLRPSLTTRSVWAVGSSAINALNRLSLKRPWRWSYGTENHRGSDGKPRGYIQFRLCDAFTLVHTSPTDGPPPDLASFDYKKERPGIDPSARNGITFEPGHTFTGAVWGHTLRTDPWTVVVPKIGDVSLDDHIGTSPVFLCLRHGLGEEQELLFDTAVFHRRVHPETYQRYMSSRSARSRQAGGSLLSSHPTPIAMQCESETSWLTTLALPVFVDVLSQLAGCELAVAAAMYLAREVGSSEAEAELNTFPSAAAEPEVLPSSESAALATMQVAPMEPARTKRLQATNTKLFSCCLPVNKRFFIRRPHPR